MQGRRDGSTSDEAFAWQSREFLRKKTVGQVRRQFGAHAQLGTCEQERRPLPKVICVILPIVWNVSCRLHTQKCTFKVDYTLPAAPGMEFGSVFVGEKNENVAAAVVAAGWAKVGVCEA